MRLATMTGDRVMKWTETWIDTDDNTEFRVDFELSKGKLPYLVGRARRNKNGRARVGNGVLVVRVSSEGIVKE